MTNPTIETSPGRPGRDLPPPSPPESEATGSVRSSGVLAGLAILAMAALAGIGQLVAMEGLVTAGDAARTADDILASEGTFRLAVASWYLVVVLDVVVAWALLRFFSPVNRGISQLAAWLRLAYAAVLMVATSQLVGIPRLLRSEDYATAFGTDQLPAQAMVRIDAFNDIWLAGLVLFGLHLGLIGYLAYQSGYVPRWVGVLLVVAGAGYVFDTFGRVLSDGSPVISTVTFVGEFVLALWLVVRARRISLGADGHGI